MDIWPLRVLTSSGTNMFTQLHGYKDVSQFLFLIKESSWIVHALIASSGSEKPSLDVGLCAGEPCEVSELVLIY